jgi:hypothetical protein
MSNRAEANMSCWRGGLQRKWWLLLCVLVAAAFTFAGCTSAPQREAPAPGAAQVAVLEPYGSLFTVTVSVAGAPRRFLVDTGGGITVFTPELAAQAACALGGPLTGFRMSRNGDSDIWIEVGTGSEAAAIINQPLAARVGLSTPVAGSGAQIDLRLDGGAPVRTPVETSAMIFDGNLGLGTMRSWVLTFDLERERVWIRTP